MSSNLTKKQENSPIQGHNTSIESGLESNSSQYIKEKKDSYGTEMDVPLQVLVRKNKSEEDNIQSSNKAQDIHSPLWRPSEDDFNWESDDRTLKKDKKEKNVGKFTQCYRW